MKQLQASFHRILLLAIFSAYSLSSLCQTISQNSQVRRYFSQAVTAKANQDYILAISLINKVIAINGKDADAYAFKATCEIFTDIEAAAEDINRSIKLDPSFAHSYYTKGMIEHYRNNYTNELDNYTIAIKKAKNSKDLSWYYYSRAAIREDLLDHTGALNDCNMSLKLDNYKNLLAYSLRGSIRLSLGDLRGALSDCNKAIEIEPGTYWTAYYTRGVAQAKLGNMDNACADLNKASELSKNNEVLEAIKKYCR